MYFCVKIGVICGRSAFISCPSEVSSFNTRMERAQLLRSNLKGVTQIYHRQNSALLLQNLLSLVATVTIILL